ncbi:MAG: hypothetical protein MMC23_006439 [Stictis urceolatum]|nr:hypothetical protein [Stictis urceolata]
MSGSSSAAPHPLPPSVEEAYRRKCIELRKRLADVEKDNDQLRERQLRLSRGIMKMRYERAVLLDALRKRMRKNGADGPLGASDDESEDSSEAPPTVPATQNDQNHTHNQTKPSTTAATLLSSSQSHPSRPTNTNINTNTASSVSLAELTPSQPQERPLRTKKSHRRLPNSPPPGLEGQQPLPGSAAQPPTGIFSTPIAQPASANGIADSPLPSGPAPASPSATASFQSSQQEITHPIAPRDMYTEHLVKVVLPSDPNLAAEIADSYNNDVGAYGENEWRVMGEEEKSRWNAKYEEQMREYEKAMDERKRARRGAGKGRAGAGGEDVEMDD